MTKGKKIEKEDGSRERKKKEKKQRDKSLLSNFRITNGNVQPNIVYDAEKKVWVPLNDENHHLAT